MKSHQLLKAPFQHGFLFSRPLVTYCFKTCHDASWKHYIRFLKYRHEKLYEEALSEIDSAIDEKKETRKIHFEIHRDERI